MKSSWAKFYDTYIKAILIQIHVHDKKFLLSEDRIKEKRDVDELEDETDTRKLFLEQGTLEEAKQKELAEYIDAKNKEVNWKDNNGLNFRFFSFIRATNQNVHDVMDKYKGQDAEKNKEKVAAVHSQVCDKTYY